VTGSGTEGEASPGESVGIVVVSHGPLAAALKETLAVLHPGEPTALEALSLAWDESPEKASSRLEKAIGTADRGRGVVILTDMFGGTPSNLALAFLERGRVEIVSGVNLPMVVKARAMARDGRDAHSIAHALVEKGRRAIQAASDALEAERRGNSKS
jgi:PTS system mannose-specific IIA component